MKTGAIVTGAELSFFTPNEHAAVPGDDWPLSLAGTVLSQASIDTARIHLRGVAVRTPLVRVQVPDSSRDVWLKLETLQPIGSFKIRGAGSALGAATPELLSQGVYTASAGNMAQGVAWCARARGIPCTVIVPDHAPQAKVEAVERLGAAVTRVSFERWWQVLVERSYPGLAGLFVHPVADPAVIAGNATIAREILEDAPDMDTVLVPFGGGGLACGIALGLRALGSSARVIACEVDTAAPFVAALRAGRAVRIERRASFVDGIGGQGVLPEMWPLASALLAGSMVSSLEQIAQAMRFLASRGHVIAEGAGAASVAPALSGKHIGDRTVCIISGANIDLSKLATILTGRLPDS